MPTVTVELRTADGVCATDIVSPDAKGTFPAVIFCFDAAGRRPAMTQMAERIAKGGYVVAIPDFFHRVGSPWDLLPPGPKDFHRFSPLFADPEKRQKVSTYMKSATSNEHIKVDVAAVIAHLTHRHDVRPDKMGVTGYCMGGNLAVRIGELFPDHIRAVGAFHPGGLVSGEADSPHLSVDKLKAEVLVVGAVEDGSFSDDARGKLDAALTAAHVKHVVTTYPGALHGFATLDHPKYDKAASDRQFKELGELLHRTLA